MLDDTKKEMACMLTVISKIHWAHNLFPLTPGNSAHTYTILSLVPCKLVTRYKPIQKQPIKKRFTIIILLVFFCHFCFLSRNRTDVFFYLHGFSKDLPTLASVLTMFDFDCMSNESEDHFDK